MDEHIIVPRKRNFGAPPERNFFSDSNDMAAQQTSSVPHKPQTAPKPEEVSPVEEKTPEAPKESATAVFGAPQVKTPVSQAPRAAATLEKEQKPFEKEASGLPTLRTYKQDVAGVIRDQKTSLVQLVLAEQKERRKRERDTSPTSKKNLLLIVLSAIFLLTAGGIVYYIFFTLKPADNTLEMLKITPLVFSENNREIAVSGKDKKTLQSEMSAAIQKKDLRLDAIEYIFFTDAITRETPQGVIEEKNLITTAKFFQTMNLELPSVIARSLRGEFMFGVHAFNKNQPFLVLKTDYYDNAFAGMLEWEKDAARDLLPLFDQPELIRELAERKWGDMVIKNKDTRVLRNFDGSIALVYMFKDQHTLIITTNEDTLLEVSRRLDTAQEKPVQN